MSFQEFYPFENSGFFEREESSENSYFQSTSLNLKHFLSQSSQCNSKLFENGIEPSEKKILNQYIPFKKGYRHYEFDHESIEMSFENKISQDLFLIKKQEEMNKEK